MPSQSSDSAAANRGEESFRLGDAVFDSAGEKLGDVTRVIVDADAEIISGLVVKPSGMFEKERIVPRDMLEAAAGGFHSKISAADFEDLSPFDSGAFRAPDPGYTGPPGFDRESLRRSNLALDAAVAIGPLAGIGSSVKPFGYPSSEISAPAASLAATGQQLPMVERGAGIIDVAGRKVGDVEEIAFDGDGRPSSIVVRQGFLFAKQFEIPPEWIERISDKGVILNVAEDRLQAVVGGS